MNLGFAFDEKEEAQHGARAKRGTASVLKALACRSAWLILDRWAKAEHYSMEPDLVTEPHLGPVLKELMRREPIFHGQAFGTSRAELESVTAEEFWEVGASGRRYSREHVIDGVEKRGDDPMDETWVTSDFHCLEIAPENYLLTYTLRQGQRQTRRSTIWRRTSDGWKIVYHQGTIVASA